jgi:ABC-type polysaccharide/polyol phosphate transport system ATPase subunit
LPLISSQAPADLPAVELVDLGIRYRLPKDRTRNLKELVLLWLRRRLDFDEFWALRGVNLVVPRGERLAVIGRNGAGKSTMLQVIARILYPTTGKVTVRGRVAPLLQLGAGFDSELTGRENVYLNGALLGMRRVEIAGRLEEIARFAEVEEFLEAPLRAYSNGMAARLGFAVATASDPDILLLDEVLSVGDEGFKLKCLQRMREFAQRGTTMVLVTHDPALVMEHGTRAIWLEDHSVRADGDPAAVLAEYHAYMAERTSSYAQ